MSNVQVNHPRQEYDLSSFCFSTGTMGRLKTLGFHPVLPGDSFEMDLCGSFKMSPLRRGLALDCKTEIFSFYVPYRMIYGLDTWSDFLRHAGGMGNGPSVTLPAFPDGMASAGDGDRAMFLATRPAEDSSLPLWLYKAYEMIFNNYFKHPQDPQGVHNSDLGPMPARDLQDGFQCFHLPALWTDTPVNDLIEDTGDAPIEGLSLAGLNQMYGMLHTGQELENFSQRYRDIMDNFGGEANPDAEQRPRLLMHTEQWSSGYDINGTDQTTLGQHTGRVAASFKHTVPRFFVPEHGVIMHVMLNRFPPIHMFERHPLVQWSSPTYADLAGDPNFVANGGQFRPLKFKEVFWRGFESEFHVPPAQWYRVHPNHVDFRYITAEGFPFVATLGALADNGVDQAVVGDTAYDHVFASTQLGHWNVQAKFNTTVLRRLPTARESVLVSC